jgi:hypothetical protein
MQADVEDSVLCVIVTVTNFSIVSITRGRQAEALRRGDLQSKESCWLS